MTNPFTLYLAFATLVPGVWHVLRGEWRMAGVWWCFSAADFLLAGVR